MEPVLLSFFGWLLQSESPQSCVYEEIDDRWQIEFDYQDVSGVENSWLRLDDYVDTYEICDLDETKYCLTGGITILFPKEFGSTQIQLDDKKFAVWLGPNATHFEFEDTEYRGRWTLTVDETRGFAVQAFVAETGELLRFTQLAQLSSGFWIAQGDYRPDNCLFSLKER